MKRILPLSQRVGCKTLSGVIQTSESPKYLRDVGGHENSRIKDKSGRTMRLILIDDDQGRYRVVTSKFKGITINKKKKTKMSIKL